MSIKKIIILVVLILHFGLIHAQRFFYVDNNQITENLLKGSLLRASQHISSSPLSSDYIVKSEVGFQEGNHILTLQINLQDSITAQSIYQITETYAFGDLNSNSRNIMRTVIRTFIEKNISQLVISAKENHFDDRMNNLQSRKDKT
jgi:hypothetical protein